MATKVPTATIQIQEKLVGRLSPDLVAMASKDNSFAWSVDEKRRKLTLDSGGKSAGNRLKVWGSNQRARSGYIGLGSVLSSLGIEHPDKLIGQTFEAEVKGKTIEICF